jgi:hypothetical protein
MTTSPHTGGRPPKNAADRKIKRSVYCKDEIYEQLVEFAESKGKSFSDFLIYAAQIEMSAISQDALLKRIWQLTAGIQVTYASITGKSTTMMGASAAPVANDEAWQKYRHAKDSQETAEMDSSVNLSLAKLGELKAFFEKGVVKPSEIKAANQS